MKIVLDTNIIFSALLNSNSMIANLLFNNKPKYYSVHFLKEEIYNHNDKLLSISKLSAMELEQSKELIFKNIQFVNEFLIPSEYWIEASKICYEIDNDDIPFVALSMFLNATLWTGDKKLYNGLKLAGFSNIANTQEIKEIILTSNN